MDTCIDNSNVHSYIALPVMPHFLITMAMLYPCGMQEICEILSNNVQLYDKLEHVKNKKSIQLKHLFPHLNNHVMPLKCVYTNECVKTDSYVFVNNTVYYLQKADMPHILSVEEFNR
ncbi:hypothetical protein GpSGHVEth134 [Glossina pallidipes salivary gland hypertrophy virus]|uniref:Uncharacterized protein n=2 Tax=Glossina hytrovirus (isolate Glossina pallidipes/Ethiopia/Seibersdorf/-) TaxID=379529 RepID=B0YLS6_GHVS|nr:hypothetical protein SGHV122 [Glossina pallidipes salivary gland hypertrophy virus]ABQ08895.1 hypothetical protein SGHV122 [Glossina pallidipes salivary gland hypertrophy virus]AMB48738.1 hypothetical protein GpSGHVEth134 [Glossina pallidipes salivary gland hypertrophy virus]